MTPVYNTALSSFLEDDGVVFLQYEMVLLIQLHQL